MKIEDFYLAVKLSFLMLHSSPFEMMTTIQGESIAFGNLLSI